MLNAVHHLLENKNPNLRGGVVLYGGFGNSCDFGGYNAPHENIEAWRSRAIEEFERCYGRPVLELVEETLGLDHFELGTFPLDLHMMNKNLFLSIDGHYANERDAVIKQCRDGTFWHSVLSEGKLYNPENKIFDIHVNDKYPRAVELFKQ
ncbi:hypothetical protein HQ489_01985 [Candidatus Woesearchaeota archaeon]|nr:hypothetical protein [Candidatus Woesearchaeota archaeon]